MYNQYTYVACILLPITRYNWMPVYSVDQAPGSCILRRKKLPLSIWKIIRLGFKSSAPKTNIHSENFRCRTAIIVHYTLTAVTTDTSPRRFFLSVETRVFVDVTAGLNPMKNPLRARVGGNRRNVRSRGKQIALFSRESWSFPRGSRGKHQDSRENKTN